MRLMVCSSQEAVKLVFPRCSCRWQMAPP